MNFLKKDQFQQGPDLTEDIFLETIAKRICEIAEYDIDPDFAKTVGEAQDDAISTLQRTHNDKDREQIYTMLEIPNSATFGQDISKMIGQEMVRKKTGQSWEG